LNGTSSIEPRSLPVPHPRFWPDVVEILLVAFVIYRFLLFLVGTRAMSIVVGVMILSVAYFAALLAKFT